MVLWYLHLRCRGKRNIFKMCQIIHRYIKPVHLEMRPRSLELLWISDLEDVFCILIGCLKMDILQLTPNVSPIRTKWLLKFPILNMFLWKQRRGKQCSARDTQAEQGWGAVGRGTGQSQSDSLDPASSKIWAAAQVGTEVGVRAEDVEVPSNLNCSTVLNGVDDLMII